MKASSLDKETPGSVLDALCEIDFPIPWKCTSASREVSDGRGPSLKKRLRYLGHILFPQLHVLWCIYGSPLC